MLDSKAKSGILSKPSNALGFGFNAETVKTELAQIQSVVDEYLPMLMTGAEDTDAVLPQFNAKLKKMGLDKFFSEVQNQLNTWKANKK